MKQEKNRELVKAQKMDQTVPVEAYCGKGYVSANGSTWCQSGYSCGGANGVSSPMEEDDVLL